MPDENVRVKLTGLWKNESKAGKTYLAGSLGSARIMIFPNGYKEKNNDPDYIMYLVPGKPKDRPSTGDDRRPERRDVGDADLPF